MARQVQTLYVLFTDINRFYIRAYCVCGGMWRSEVKVKCLPQLLSIHLNFFFFLRQCLSPDLEPAHKSDLLSSGSSALGSQAHAVTSGFYMHTRDTSSRSSDSLRAISPAAYLLLIPKANLLDIVEILSWKLKNPCGNLLQLRVHPSWDDNLSLAVWGLSSLPVSQPIRKASGSEHSQAIRPGGAWCCCCSLARLLLSRLFPLLSWPGVQAFHLWYQY